MAGRLRVTMHFKRLKLRRSASVARDVPSKPPVVRTAPSVFGQGVAVILDDPSLLLRVRLPIRLTNGNDGRGHNWLASARFRADVGRRLLAWGLKRTPFEVPVNVHLIRVFGPRERAWDSSSWQRGNWKEIEDALCEPKPGQPATVMWFHNDSKQWIKLTTFSEDATQRSTGPALIVEIRKAD